MAKEPEVPGQWYYKTEIGPTWLDEVAARVLQAFLTESACPGEDEDYFEWCEKNAEQAYDVAEAFLDEGERRKTAEKGPQMPQEGSEGVNATETMPIDPKAAGG